MSSLYRFPNEQIIDEINRRGLEYEVMEGVDDLHFIILNKLNQGKSVGSDIIRLIEILTGKCVFVNNIVN